MTERLQRLRRDINAGHGVIYGQPSAGIKECEVIAYASDIATKVTDGEMDITEVKASVVKSGKPRYLVVYNWNKEIVFIKAITTKQITKQ